MFCLPLSPFLFWLFFCFSLLKYEWEKSYLLFLGFVSKDFFLMPFRPAAFMMRLRISSIFVFRMPSRDFALCAILSMSLFSFSFLFCLASLSIFLYISSLLFLAGISLLRVISNSAFSASIFLGYSSSLCLSDSRALSSSHTFSVCTGRGLTSCFFLPDRASFILFLEFFIAL